MIYCTHTGVKQLAYFSLLVEPEEVVYDEPYPLAQRPKTELQMEPCPAYGIVLSPGTHTQ